MSPKHPPSIPKEDRNTHETSGDEARPTDSHDHQTSGGGHRSGSRGAGTFENSDGKLQPRRGPSHAK